MIRDKALEADTEEVAAVGIMMTDAEEAMAVAVAGTTIEVTEESEDIVMMTVDMPPVELTAIAGTTVTDAAEMSDEVEATTTVTIEVAIVKAADLVKLPLLLLMVIQLLVERVGNHMLEVEETLMTDTVVTFDR